MLTVGENTVNTSTFKSRPLNLYVVAEDCAPSKENEGILFIRKGQVGGAGREGGRGVVAATVAGSTQLFTEKAFDCFSILKCRKNEKH